MVQYQCSQLLSQAAVSECRTSAWCLLYALLCCCTRQSLCWHSPLWLINLSFGCWKSPVLLKQRLFLSLQMHL